MMETWSDGADELGELADTPVFDDRRPVGLRRRAIVKGLAALGIGGVTFRRAVAARSADRRSPCAANGCALDCWVGAEKRQPQVEDRRSPGLKRGDHAHASHRRLRRFQHLGR